MQTSQSINAWIASLLKNHGEHLLRMKGTFQISDENRTVILQAVGQAFDPPREVQIDQKSTNIVVILDYLPDGFQSDKLFLLLSANSEGVIL